MNRLEKRSFYSFLGLYIFTSVVFVLVSGYLYYDSKREMYEKENYYRMEHLADSIAGRIIHAHMQHTPFRMPPIPEDIAVALVSKRKTTIRNRIPLDSFPDKAGFYQNDFYTLLVSDAARRHLDIDKIVLYSETLPRTLHALRVRVVSLFGVVLVVIILVAWILSKLFLRPIRERVAQIERFVKDIAHELNTPVSALRMSTERMLAETRCDTKRLRYISVSTRQLYDIYRSLAYLNFERDLPSERPSDLAEALRKAVAYYSPLAEMKHIVIDLTVDSDATCRIPENRLALLFGNLIGNAIKYSPSQAHIAISLHGIRFRIADRGIGIDKARQKEIFESYVRGTDYSGGFGIGLSVVRRICDNYDIALSLASEKGEGTTFTLDFRGCDNASSS